ncbi:MAG: invasion associated locus B family protein [Devosia sp.]
MFRGVPFMISTRRRIASGLLAAAFLATAPISAVLGQTDPGANATNLGTYNKTWTAWQGVDLDGGLVCYIEANPDSSEPTQVGGKPINRDPPKFLVVHRKAAGKTNEAQTLIGYPLSTDLQRQPTALIDGHEFNMLGEKNAAWLAQETDQPGFVAAMKAGTKLVVKGMSLRGTVTTDTYSLGGVTAALAKIDEACR